MNIILSTILNEAYPIIYDQCAIIVLIFLQGYIIDLNYLHPLHYAINLNQYDQRLFMMIKKVEWNDIDYCYLNLNYLKEYNHAYIYSNFEGWHFMEKL